MGRQRSMSPRDRHRRGRALAALAIFAAFAAGTQPARADGPDEAAGPIAPAAPDSPTTTPAASAPSGETAPPADAPPPSPAPAAPAVDPAAPPVDAPSTATSTPAGSGTGDPAAAPTSPPASQAPRAAAISARVLLKVVHPAEARKAIAEAAEPLGGHPTYVSDARLKLKVSPEHVSAMLDGLAAHGLVIEKELSREDLTEQLARLDGGLRSKLEVFGRLRKLLDDAPVTGTLAIEKDMTALVMEIERLKGELRVAEDRVRFASVEVQFRFERRERLKDAHSPFPWINTVDLDRFLGGF